MCRFRLSSHSYCILPTALPAKRGGCVPRLHQAFYDEMQSAVIFPDVLEIHHDLLSFIPQDIPEAEQSYYLANIYSLLLEQDKK